MNWAECWPMINQWFSVISIFLLPELQFDFFVILFPFQLLISLYFFSRTSTLLKFNFPFFVRLLKLTKMRIILWQWYLVMGLGRQVHFSQRITMVMNMMTPPEALNTRVVESVLKIVFWMGDWQLGPTSCWSWQYFTQNIWILLWYSNHLEDIEADIDEDGACEVSFKHLVSLFAVALLCIWSVMIMMVIIIIIIMIMIKVIPSSNL